MKRKLILAAAMFALIAAAVFAQSANPESDFEFKILKKGTYEFAAITKYVGDKAEVTIPWTIRESPRYDVKEIAPKAFAGCTFITSIDLGLVSQIGAGAFKDCTNLTSVKIQGGLGQQNIIGIDESLGDLKKLYLDKKLGGGGLYTRSAGDTRWTKKMSVQ